MHVSSLPQCASVSASHSAWLTQLGLSTVPYTATAVLLKVSIRPRTVLYSTCTHLAESPHWYSTVATMAIYGSRRVYRAVSMGKPGLWPRDSLRNLKQTSVTWVLSHLLCNWNHFVEFDRKQSHMACSESQVTVTSKTCGCTCCLQQQHVCI
jgi:hypothetical protein